MKRKAFTLIELLVVISIVVLLMALMLPALRRVRDQAKATQCRSRLRQWSLVFKMYTDSNEGRWFNWLTYNARTGRHSPISWLRSTFDFWEEPALALCPMATTPRWPPGTFHAWPGVGLGWNSRGVMVDGAISYGFNDAAYWPAPAKPGFVHDTSAFYWGVCDAKGAANIPILYDSITDGGHVSAYLPPPEADTFPAQHGGYVMCTNRHNGGINMLFMDWSVRKVGLKELWTFKWHPTYDTAGPWTKRGGVQPSDWPQWMRQFKDY